MYLEIISPDENIYSGEIKLIQIPGSKGLFEVLHNHAPIISTLEKGKIKIQTSKNEQLFFDIAGGVIEVKNNKIIVLVDTF
jgi:F-type H+-transporting ATPase subunit epsilon